MTTTASPHSISVFTNSCRSTPRNPRTRLPADRLDQSKSPDIHLDAKTISLTSSAGRQHTNSARVRAVWSHTSQPHNAGRPCTAPAATERPQMGGEEGMDSSYSALFSTLLESNALLRDEIQQLRQDHRRTLSALELLHVQNLQGVPQHTQTSSRRVADVSSLKEAEGNYRDEVPTAPMGEYRLTKNLPTHPLKDAWVDPQESDLLSSQHAPLRQQGDELHSNSSLTSSGHSSEEENQQTHNRSPGSPSTPASSDHEEEWAGEDQAEMVEGAAVGILSDSSAHSIPAASSSRSVDSSLVSFSGSGTPSESAQSEGNGDPFASPGLVAIGTMWDDFSVEDYAPYEPDKEGAKEKEEWAPRITIPEPFSMTLREERNPKKKSKSMLITEREKMEREAKEEAELKKQFHATPVPASTYIPLYELINAKNHQRREQVQELTKDLLKSTERPFSFTKRDKEKKRLKAEMVRQSQLEKAKSDKEQKFRARPVPKRLFDPQVNEQIREEEEYRRIRVKMRAEELLANSKLPGSMRSRKYTDGELRRRRLEDKQSRAFMTRDHRFHPRINPKVPDYDQLFTDFQKELARRKKANRTTTVEPFYLRTELIPSRKEQVEQELQRDDHVLPETRWPYMAPRSKVSCMAPGVSNHFRSRSAPYPAQLTETARIRQSLTQEKLAGAAEKEVSDEQRRRAKKDRQRELQKAVSQRSVACDPTAWLEDRKKQKLQEFRRLERERQEKYRQELEDMQQRLESRPLLIEQPSLAAAQRSAEAKYIATLKKAGLSDEQIQAMSQGTTEH